MGLFGGSRGPTLITSRLRQRAMSPEGQALAGKPTSTIPDPPLVTPGADNAAAQAAGAAQRKRAARGSLMTRPVSAAGPMPGASLTPKTLKGY